MKWHANYPHLTLANAIVEKMTAIGMALVEVVFPQKFIYIRKPPVKKSAGHLSRLMPDFARQKYVRCTEILSAFCIGA